MSCCPTAPKNANEQEAYSSASCEKSKCCPVSWLIRPVLAALVAGVIITALGFLVFTWPAVISFLAPVPSPMFAASPLCQLALDVVGAFIVVAIMTVYGVPQCIIRRIMTFSLAGVLIASGILPFAIWGYLTLKVALFHSAFSVAAFTIGGIAAALILKPSCSVPCPGPCCKAAPGGCGCKNCQCGKDCQCDCCCKKTSCSPAQ